MTNKGFAGFPSTDNVVPDGTITSAKLAASGQPWWIPNQLATGEETLPRMLLAGGGSTSSGGIRLTYFTARKTETCTRVRLITGATAAAATPSLCRIGIYSVDSYGAAVLVASTANDTTLFATATTAYTRSFTSPLNKVAGQRYAAAYIVVSGTTMPIIAGTASDLSPGGRAEAAISPRVAAVISGQSDLVASFLESDLVTGQVMNYMVILP